MERPQADLLWLRLKDPLTACPVPQSAAASRKLLLASPAVKKRSAGCKRPSTAACHSTLWSLRLATCSTISTCLCVAADVVWIFVPRVVSLAASRFTYTLRASTTRVPRWVRSSKYGAGLRKNCSPMQTRSNSRYWILLLSLFLFCLFVRYLGVHRCIRNIIFLCYTYVFYAFSEL